MRAPTPVELRRGLLAVSVLHDVDMEIGDSQGGDGASGPPAVLLPGTPPVQVGESECRRALAGADPGSDAGHDRLAGWLLARRWAADAGPDHLRRAVRPVGVPVGSRLHPGLDWVRVRVLGDALDLGLGAVGIDPAEPDRVVVLPPPALEAAGVDAAAAWSAAERELERLGALAAERLRLDPRRQLRPVGDCDVVTLLGSRALRSCLAQPAGGMAALAVPMRRRGWTDLRLIDPAFAPAAAAATAPAERGFARPLLVTEHEVSVVAAGGRTTGLALRDPGADRPWDRDVLYR